MQPTSIEIIKKLREAGHEAYWAGGCVRDILLNVKPKDFDIATSAKPEEIENLLEETIPVGKEFGVILAIKDGHHFEIATFRSDSGYSDGRRPDAVLFTSAKDDASRRDFTINGMFYDPTEDKVIDYVNGQQDIEEKMIRFIGEPNQRIEEDHLRILRAIRFKNTLEFQYHPDTYKALVSHSELVKKVSHERVRDELNKMLGASPKGRRGAFEDMEDTGVLKAILPECIKMRGVAQPTKYHHEGDVWHHTLQCMESLSDHAGLSLRWAILLHDIGKPQTFKMRDGQIHFDGHSEKGAEMAERILKRLKLPLKDIKKVRWLVNHHMMVWNVLDMNISRRRHWFLHPWFLDLLELHRADALGTDPSDISMYKKVKELYHKDVSELPEEPAKLLSGEDVMDFLGYQPGPEIGEVLDELREKQLTKEIITKPQALTWLKKKKKEKKNAN